jgi:hypothetical protein
MKKTAYLLCLLPFCCACEKKNDVTPQASTAFATTADAKAFFYNLDDQHNRAMVAKDSAYFIKYYAPAYYNCTPNTDLNNRPAEIQTLLHTPWAVVERMAPQFDVFAYAGDLAAMTVTKRIKLRTPAGEQTIYVRRCIVFQKANDQWQAISGQGTYVATRYVGQ